MDTMGDRIHKLRQERGLTLQELGDRVGVGASTVRKWETGMIKSLRTDKVANLANALNTTTEYLMGWIAATNATTATAQEPLPDESAELLRIYRSLPVRAKLQLLTMAYSLEDENK